MPPKSQSPSKDAVSSSFALSSVNERRKIILFSTGEDKVDGEGEEERHDINPLLHTQRISRFHFLSPLEPQQQQQQMSKVILFSWLCLNVKFLRKSKSSRLTDGI